MTNPSAYAGTAIGRPLQPTKRWSHEHEFLQMLLFGPVWESSVEGLQDVTESARHLTARLGGSLRVAWHWRVRSTKFGDVKERLFVLEVVS